MIYNISPVGTSGVRLSEGLPAPTEVLARNAHKNWSRRRIAEGRCYGHVYDDARKEHPRLAPYEDPCDPERETTRETIKALLALGYRIEPPSADDAFTTDARTR